MTNITVGVPSFNSAKYIEETILSLKNQIFEDWICVISDDNSSDDTVNIVKRLIQEDSRFTLVEHKTNLGACANWNFLLSETHTKYFKLLHADDLLHPLNLQIAMRTFQLNPDCVLLSSNRKYSAKPSLNWNVKENNKYSKLDRNQVLNKYINKGFNFIAEPSFVIYDTKVLQKVGGFSKTWNYLIDLDSYFKVLNFGTLIKIKENLGVFRISKNSWSARLLNNQLKEEYKFLIHISNKKKRVISGLASISIRSILRQIYFRIFV